MPTKPNKAGNEQNYVPKGNGDASGEYADNASGSNIHYFSKFKKPEGVVKSIEPKKKITKDTKLEEMDLSIDELKELEKEIGVVDEEVDLMTDKQIKKMLDEEEQKQKEEIEIEIKEQPKSKNTEVKKFIKENKNAVKELGAEKVKNILIDTYTEELDIEKVKNLTDDEILKLATALNIVDNKQEFLTNAEKVKADFLDQVAKDEVIGGNNVWKMIPNTNPEDFEKSLDAKIEYFNQIVNADGPLITDDIKKLAQQRIDALNKLKNSKELKQWKKADESLSYDFGRYQKIVDKYQNPNNVYSQKAKNEAKWFKTVDSSSKIYGKYADKVIAQWEEKDSQAIQYIKDYTGSYSSINHPLRDFDYPHKQAYPQQSKEKQAKFLDRVEKMTKVLDSSTYDFNCWVQRGVTQLNVGSNMLNYNSSAEDLNKLVGTTFKDQGFLSCGSHKGGGFASNNIIMNIYCPKGTKMLYVKSLSHYSSEDETIINRGYSYKITKVEKKNGKTYMDCEVVLGSDKDRYSHEQLQELSTKHF